MHCLELSEVVKFECGRLEFARCHLGDVFVFGGDVFDKGNGDIRIARLLLDFKADPDLPPKKPPDFRGASEEEREEHHRLDEEVESDPDDLGYGQYH